jgi:SAM-dependent methyltransferase
MVLKPEQDAFGQEMLAHLRGETVYEIIERDDGFIHAAPGAPAMYFAPFEDWISQESQAIAYSQGRALDIGCGAGRVGLYLQSKGFEVVGIDTSPGALEACRQRDFTTTHLLSISQIGPELGVFDTIVMFGNNFGLLSNYQRAKWLLKRLHRLTSPEGRILAMSNDIYQTTDPLHRAYHESNRKRGRMSGQVRIRVRYKNIKSPWFDYLLVSPQEMEDILDGTGWEIQNLIKAEGSPIYAAILSKGAHSK